MTQARYLAEAIATFALVFFGAGTVLTSGSFGSVGVLGIALATGLTITVMAYAIYSISGAHINPAVTIGLWASRRIDSVSAILYVISQLIGAGIAAVALSQLFAGSPAALNYGTPSMVAGFTVSSGIIVEAVLTFFLMLVYYAAVVDKRTQLTPVAFALGLGFMVVLGNIMAYNVTGAAMNPARAFGPALASQVWENQLIYWIGPIVGAIIAAWVYENAFIAERRSRYGRR
jgi:MIP family channel proteins